MKYKKAIIIAVSIIVIASLVAVVAYKNTFSPAAPIEQPVTTSTETSTSTQEPALLPATDESHFQQQIQRIITTGTDADCDTIADARYQSVCHSVFKDKAVQ